MSMEARFNDLYRFFRIGAVMTRDGRDTYRPNGTDWIMVAVPD
jgi:hypothetical protein